MRNLVTICSKIGARDVWPESKFGSITFANIAESLLIKYGKRLSEEYSSEPDTVYFNYIDDDEKTQAIDHDDSVKRILDRCQGSVFWSVTKESVFYHSSLLLENSDMDRIGPYKYDQLVEDTIMKFARKGDFRLAYTTAYALEDGRDKNRIMSKLQEMERNAR